MTPRRKRRREQFTVVDWAPVIEQSLAPPGKQSRGLRTVVVSGDVLQYVKVPGSKRIRQTTKADKQQVHGHWLPARVVLDGSQFRFVVDVDLVAHASPAQHERDVQRWQQAVAAGDVRSLAQPATWTRLIMPELSTRVIWGMAQSQRWTLQVTQVKVLPLPQQPGRRGQAAVDRSVPVLTADLLRAALDAVQLHGVLRRVTASDAIGVLQVGKGVRTPPRRTERTAHTRELLARVRDVHQAAPHGSKLQAVMQHFGYEKRKAQVLVNKSQKAMQWGKAHERSKQSRNKHKKGGKT